MNIRSVSHKKTKIKAFSVSSQYFGFHYGDQNGYHAKSYYGRRHYYPRHHYYGRNYHGCKSHGSYYRRNYHHKRTTALPLRLVAWTAYKITRRSTLLILRLGYRGVFITREDRKGNLSGYVFKGNPDGRLFGKQAVQDILRQNAAASAGEILNKILSALSRFQGSLEPEDDVTLVVVKIEEDA